uniref:Uncharacterized protein n=1 Tax=Oryzias latipes TaxID=8090 RepID=A0A3B3HXL0_ORYLA
STSPLSPAPRPTRQSLTAGPTRQSLTAGPTPCQTLTAGPTPCQTLTAGPTPCQTLTAGPTPCQTLTAGPTPCQTLTAGPTPCQTLTAGPTPCQTLTAGPTPCQTLTAGPTPCQTLTAGPTPCLKTPCVTSFKEVTSFGCCQVSVRHMKSNFRSTRKSWTRCPLLVSERMFSRPKLAVVLERLAALVSLATRGQVSQRGRVSAASGVPQRTSGRRPEISERVGVTILENTP